MLNFWKLNLSRILKRLSLRAGIYAAAAIGAAMAAVIFAPQVPDSIAELLGGDGVNKVLTILASSMLAVVTFSIANLIASFSVLSSSAPPRATALVMSDSSSHAALSTFLGAFIFSVVSLVALSTHYYGQKGRAILFLLTILIIGSVIWKIIGWIGYLSGLGQVRKVIEEVEKQTKSAIDNSRIPFEWKSEPFKMLNNETASYICQKETCGFIQSIDLERLAKLSETFNIEIYLQALPGEFVLPGSILLFFTGQNTEPELVKKITDCFLVGEYRTFEHDARFGFIVLSEIGCRALSPGINDPGTAIQVITSLTRLMLYALSSQRIGDKCKISRKLHIRPINTVDLFDDSFRAIARDGAGQVEVGIFLQKALKGLSSFKEFSVAARLYSNDSLLRSQAALHIDSDIQRIKKIIASNV